MYVPKCAFCLVHTWWHVCIDYAHFCYIRRIIIWWHNTVTLHNMDYIVYITDVMQCYSVMTSYNDFMNITKMSVVHANMLPCVHWVECIFWDIHGMDIKLQLQSNFSGMIPSQYLFPIRSYGQFKNSANLQRFIFHARKITIYGNLWHPKNTPLWPLPYHI